MNQITIRSLIIHNRIINRSLITRIAFLQLRNTRTLLKILIFILKRYIDESGQVDRGALTSFLDTVIPKNSIKDRLEQGEELTLLTRFIIYIDLVKGVRRFSIPDLGIKLNEGQIPEYVYSQHKGNLVDGVS